MCHDFTRARSRETAHKTRSQVNEDFNQENYEEQDTPEDER